MAGWVDVIGLTIFFNERSSFLTGRASKLGEYLASGNTEMFLFVLLIVISFIIGAMLSTKITIKFGFIWPLTFSSILLTITAFTGLYSRFIGPIGISAAMGAQNAATSMTDINRTTHLSGPATDIGINLAYKNYNRAIFWALRWFGFALGAAIGYIVYGKFLDGGLNSYTTLLIPALIIFIVGLLDKFKFKLQILNFYDGK